MIGMEGTLDFGALILRALGSLALVLALLFALLYLFKRTRRLAAKGAATHGIRLLARQSVGPRHHLVMVEAADRLLLLGISPEGIRLLSPLGSAGASLLENQSATVAGTPQATFPDILQQMTDRNA
jgi:flagellar protein FliO/FliZ